jgi:hypothetical protein
MDEKQKGLLEVFRRLDPVNQADMLAHVRVAYSAQENTKRQYGLPDREPEPRQAGRREAV